MSRADMDRLLAEAIAPERRAFRIAGALAAAATIAAVLLLGLSGWFITGAALAGLGGVLAAQGFNYLVPSAMIRLLAIVRTTARYGERLYGHRAALMALATVRARLFDRILSVRDVRAVSAGDTVTRLVQDIGALEDSLVRRPALPAALAGAVIGLVLAWLASPWASLALLALIAGLALWANLATPRLLTIAATDIAAALARLKVGMVDYASASPEILAYDLAPAIERSLAVETAELDRARRRFARGEAVIDAGLTLGGGIAMGAVLAISNAPLPMTVLAVLASAGAIETLSGYIRGVSRGALVTAALARLEDMAGPHSAPIPAKSASGPIGRSIALDRGGVHVRLNLASAWGLLDNPAAARPACSKRWQAFVRRIGIQAFALMVSLSRRCRLRRCERPSRSRRRMRSSCREQCVTICVSPALASAINSFGQRWKWPASRLTSAPCRTGLTNGSEMAARACRAGNSNDCRSRARSSRRSRGCCSTSRAKASTW